MRVEYRTAQPSYQPLVTVGRAIREGFVLSGAFITSVDGLYYISELALSIFALADRVAEHAPKALHGTVQILRGHPALHRTINLVRGYMDFTCVLDLINRAKEWVSRDENGNFIWQRGFPTVAYYVSLTVSDIANHLFLLDKLQFIKIARHIGPINVVFTAATMSQQLFDAWTTFDQLLAAICKMERSKVRHLQWQVYKLSEIDEVRTMVRRKAQKWLTISLGGETERTREKVKLWTKISQTKNDSELHEFVNSMTDRASVVENNSSIKVLTTYCSLVCTVSYLALLILQAFVTYYYALPELILASAILLVMVNAIYVGDFIVEHYFKEATLPEPLKPTVFIF